MAYGDSLDVYGAHTSAGTIADAYGANGSANLDETGTASGSGVVINGCSGGSSQQWIVEPNTTGQFKIKNAASGRYLRDPSSTDGTALTVADSASNNDQVWRIYAVQ
jgi:hypothetical protein